MAGLTTRIMMLVTANTKQAEESFNRINKKLSQQQKTVVKWANQFNVSNKRMLDGLKAQGLAVNKSGRVFDAFTGRLTNTTKAMRGAFQMTQRFRMELLSVMFGGMLIQRVFGGILRSTTETFKKIVESSEITGTNIHKLSAAFTFLKFTIGDAINTALGPLLPFLLKLIIWAADFVAAHPEAVFASIVGLFLTGGFLFAVASFGLFMSGLSQWGPSVKLGIWLGKKGLLAAWVLRGAGILLALKGIGDLEDDAIKGAQEILAGLGIAGFAMGKIKFKGGVAIASAIVLLSLVDNPDNARALGKFIGTVMAAFLGLGQAIEAILKEAWFAFFDLRKPDFANALSKANISFAGKEFLGGINEGLRKGGIGELKGFVFEDVLMSYASEADFLGKSLSTSLNPELNNTQVMMENLNPLFGVATEGLKNMTEKELEATSAFLELWDSVKKNIGESPGLTELIELYIRAGEVMIIRINEITLALMAERMVVDSLVRSIERLNDVQREGGIGAFEGANVSTSSTTNFNITVNAEGVGGVGSALEEEIRTRLNTLPG